MLHPDYLKYKNLYELNSLSFQTKYEIINSPQIMNILPPFPSFLDQRNKKGADNYARYCNQANYVAFPNICLQAVLGIVNKGVPTIKLPLNMTDLLYYANEEGTSIQSIQNNIIESIFKFGLAGILVTIPENVSIASTTPKLKVIPGNKIVDFQTFKDETGINKLRYITIDTSRYVFNPETKNYSYTKLYTIHALNREGIYTISEILASSYGTFNIESPTLTEGVVSIKQPTWTETLNFIPFTSINKLDCSLKFSSSFIQDLIDLSLQNFRLEANLCWIESNASASHLVIKGRNLGEVTNYPTGAGAVHVLNDESSQEYYVTPSIAGMGEIKQHIQENISLANEMMYQLTNVASNSSGEALKIRINSKMQDLVGLMKNIYDGITLALENVDEILNQGINRDYIEAKPNLDFSNFDSMLNTTVVEKVEEEIK